MTQRANFLLLSVLMMSLGITAAVCAAPSADTPPASAKKPSATNGNNKEPIEVSSDKLDVFQEDNKAVFTGNVIAVQGTTTMRAAEMTVFYHDNSKKTAGTTPGAAPAKPAPTVSVPTPSTGIGKADAPAKGISRIEAKDGVVLTTPTETAQGDFGIYNVDTNMIDLTGTNVILTHDQNVLKGRKLNYNLTTGRSIFTAGDGSQSVSGPNGTKTGRVHGLFITQSDKGKAAKPVAYGPTQPTLPSPTSSPTSTASPAPASDIPKVAP